MTTDALKKEFRMAFEVARLNEIVMKRLSKDDSKTLVAVGFIFLAALCAALGSLLFPIHQGSVVYAPSFFEAVGQAFRAVILIGIGVWILNFIADALFKGAGSFSALLRPVGYGYVVGVLNVFPLLTFFVSIWILIVVFKSVRLIKQLSVGQTVVAFILLGVFLSVLMGLFDLLNPADLYGGLYVGGYE